MKRQTPDSVQAALSTELAELMYRYADKESGTAYERELFDDAETVASCRIGFRVAIIIQQ